MIMSRPMPPASVLDELVNPVFEPAPELVEWARQTFIADDAKLYNPDHHHLNFASIGALWTNVGNSRKGRQIIGQCEEGSPSGMMGKWGKARAEMQITQWFGHVLDFVMTFDAVYCAECSDAEFCALIEHEMYHAAQDRDPFGAPKFRKSTGLPVFALRGHDIEEFVGVVRRYGADASHVRALVDAANAGPEIANVGIAHACGTCQLRAA
ncbi:putative metallopeptidase [Phyllobacterium zundukense]|uniref:Putative phage metallopeptidase domain-containing protein n=1 Tax=Phyllobacterium zundukense TaxID=1867719 RepID=A0A2N9VW50_9HYPH|nr:putative metallopeptidase [Phyllobacterium zundukense]ATU91451.1 hypothetical protein BLM14_07265 [Phyllobacterium zundukense]PIO43718.1 hypothetical protein B5P45_17645 [Phyllobacterium zundukense]